MSEGNPYTYCYPKRLDQPLECEFDGDCPSQKACINNKCVNPCRAIEPCGRNSVCKVLDTLPVRTMICSCPVNMVPDANGECKRITIVKEGCSSDEDCAGNLACLSGVCKNPCNCGVNSDCKVHKHKPVCSCKIGHEGDPNVVCHAIGCRSNSECEHDKACVNSHCISPCLLDNPCSANAECFVQQNKAQCRCANGYIGDPYQGCRAIECLGNNDCPHDKFCDQLNGVCLNPCHYENKCSPGAHCVAQDHSALCKCNDGLNGNPYILCKLDDPQPECIHDGDCPNILACIDAKCQEPCATLHPCTSPAKCQAIPTLPVRTILCVCPEGYISSGSGVCKLIESIRVIGCIADSDCAPEKSCVNNLCREPCNCGPNAECRVKEHKPVKIVILNMR